MANKFKIGDRVIVVRNYGEYNVTRPGSYGVVIEFPFINRFAIDESVKVKFDYVTNIMNSEISPEFIIHESDLEYYSEYILDKKLELLNEQV